MVNDLEVPLALAGLQIERDEALAEQPGPGAIAAVRIDGWRLDRQVHKPGFWIRRHLGPHAGVAGPVPGAILPGVVTEFAGTGHRVEAPELLAGSDVEGAHQPFGVVRVLVAESFG